MFDFYHHGNFQSKPTTSRRSRSGTRVSQSRGRPGIPKLRFDVWSWGSDLGGRNRLGAGFWFWVVQVPVCGGSVVEVYGIHVGLEVGAA